MIVLYFSSASGSQEFQAEKLDNMQIRLASNIRLQIKKQQVRIKQILDGKKIEYEVKDLASDSDLRTKMRELMADDTALPPQIFNGDQYCGNYKAFDEAIEEENLKAFLKLE